MNSEDQRLLEEFRTYLKKKFDKQCVEAFIKQPLPSSITQQALNNLKQVIDEVVKA